MAVNIRRAAPSDLEAIVALVSAKRAQLESYEPVTWHPSEHAPAMSKEFFRAQMGEQGPIFLVAAEGDAVIGFINAVLQPAPPVYDPGGKTVMIDDFAVIDGSKGDEAAIALLDAALSEGRGRGAIQVIIVAAAKDERAAAWFRARNLHVFSQWWTAVLSH
jgi:hypothetical protein